MNKLLSKNTKKIKVLSLEEAKKFDYTPDEQKVYKTLNNKLNDGTITESQYRRITGGKRQNDYGIRRSSERGTQGVVREDAFNAGEQSHGKTERDDNSGSQRLNQESTDVEGDIRGGEVKGEVTGGIRETDEFNAGAEITEEVHGAAGAGTEGTGSVSGPGDTSDRSVQRESEVTP
ncbi:MAG: hypothetical protein N2510_08645 [Ignavibacteria bacterium]|nr:hypothetical protein [Ignavibacteria bacterium]